MAIVYTRGINEGAHIFHKTQANDSIDIIVKSFEGNGGRRATNLWIMRNSEHYDFKLRIGERKSIIYTSPDLENFPVQLQINSNRPYRNAGVNLLYHLPQTLGLYMGNYSEDGKCIWHYGQQFGIP